MSSTNTNKYNSDLAAALEASMRDVNTDGVNCNHNNNGEKQQEQLKQNRRPSFTFGFQRRNSRSLNSDNNNSRNHQTVDNNPRPTGRSNSSSILYKARRSAKIPKSKIDRVGDGDTWTEAFSVSKNDPFYSQSADNNTHPSVIPGPRVRSYFTSSNTNRRVWDEPPSGATNIVWASEGMRHMAEAQALAAVVNRSTHSANNQTDDNNNNNVLSSSRRSNRATTAFDDELQMALAMSIQEAASSSLGNHNNSKNRDENDDELQRVLAISAQETIGATTTGNKTYYSAVNQDEEETVQMVSAMSINEYRASRP